MNFPIPQLLMLKPKIDRLGIEPITHTTHIEGKRQGLGRWGHGCQDWSAPML